MRKLIPFALLLFSASVLLAQGTWSPQNSGTTTKLFSVKAVNANVAWATGFSVVLRTTNGGATWTSVWPAETPLHSHTIAALDANTAMVISCAGSEDNWLAGDTKIYRTTNGGADWQTAYSSVASNAFLNCLKMMDANTGFAYGDPVGGKWMLLKTTNGGASWAQMSTAPTDLPSSSGMFGGMEILAPASIWFGAIGNVFRSTDGGASWTHSVFRFGSYITGIKFTDSNNGFVCAINVRWLGHTTDGGNTWSSTTFPRIQNSATMSYAGGTLRMIWDNTVYQSSNGASWDSVFAAPSGGFLGIDVVQAGNVVQGWAVGTDGMIYSYHAGPASVDGENAEQLPARFTLSQNYPNPFNPSTTIRYGLPVRSVVRLTVFNSLGQQVDVLQNGEQEAGYHEIRFDGSGLSSGVYFYKIEAGSIVQTRTFLLLR